MQRNNIWLLLIFLVFSQVAVAKDFGKQGTTFEIKEEGFVSMMQRKLQQLDLAEHQQKMQDVARTKVTQPVAVVGIAKATKTISYSFDPTYVLDQDVVLPCGKLLYARGTRVNPLDHMAWNGRIVFIDGRDKTQIAWVKNNYLQELLPSRGSSNESAVEKNEAKKDDVTRTKETESDGTKIVLTGGNPLELEREMGCPIYFDQAGELTTKFNISHVPAIIEQEGRLLRIKEVQID
jgi:conjugal transfer pilus assembly protein TraW